MANVFHLNDSSFAEPIDKNDKNYQIPSVAYVNSVVKQIEDALANRSTESSVPVRVNFDRGITDVYFPEEDETTDEKTVEDFNHRTLTDAQIAIFKSKASKIDLAKAIDDLRKELKSYYQAQFNQLLNDKDALSKIKDIAYMIREEATLDSFMTVLASKAPKDEFLAHEVSKDHLTNADRHALNELIKMIQLGGIDWNAKEGEPNAIKNKPLNMPANGGNADTVCGYDTDSLLNHQMENYIFGDSEASYKRETCDIVLNALNNEESKNIIHIINHSASGIFGFRSGVYKFDNESLSDCNTSKSIRGSGYVSTIFSFNGNTLKVGKNIEMRDLTILNADVEISSKDTFDNVTFENCHIKYKSSNMTTIRNCILEKCIISIDGAFLDNMFTGNRLISTYAPIYYGGNNLITNNISS